MRAVYTLLPAIAAMIGSSIPTAFANMRYLVSIRNRLNRLLKENELNNYQYDYIVNEIADDKILDAELKDHNMNINVPSLSDEFADYFRDWLDLQETDDTMTEDTSNLIRNLFDLGAASGRPEESIPSRASGSVSASYSNNGVVEFIARSDPYNTFYNGIWGFTKGNREYALQCSALGLHILDVTTTNITVVQLIYMPGGETWRDAAVHDTYAYIAAQGGSNPVAWVVNLSQLSGTSAHATNSGPITSENIKNIGNMDWGHTMNVWNGLLFLNGAGGVNTYGCKIFDLLPDPMSPTFITTYIGGDCHDSYGQTIGQKDVLFSADGSTGQYRLLDITNIRNSTQIPKIGQTSFFAGAYAHQNVVSHDGTKLYVFDEGDAFDIAVFEIGNLSSPKPLKIFQWSGEQSEGNCIVHNGAILGDYLLVAYYNAGFRVFDVSDAKNVQEVGKYETYRDPDGDGKYENSISSGGFSGAWNVATLQSGKILISDTVHGTFVVKINNPTPAPTTSSPSSSPSTSAPTTSSPTSSSPTFTPTTSPTTSAPTTSSPTSSPPTPIPPKCAKRQQVLMVQVKTDNQSTETRFNIQQRNNKTKKWKKNIIVGQDFKEEKVHTSFGCVDVKKRCYRLRMFDEGKNGIQDGFVKMSLDGDIMYSNKFVGGKKRFRRFGKCKK